MNNYEIYFNPLTDMKYIVVITEVDDDNLGSQSYEHSRHMTFEEAMTAVRYLDVSVHSSWGIKVYG